MTWLRESDSITVAELTEQVSKTEGGWKTKIKRTEELVVDLDSQLVRLDKRTSVPWTDVTSKAVAAWLDVPYKFLDRLDDDLASHLLTNLIARIPDEVAITYTKHHVVSMADPSRRVLDIPSLVGVVGRVIDPKAEVVEWHLTPEFFQADVLAPEGYKRAEGGDRKVGDITRGGVRLGYDRKRNLAPFTQTWLYRLQCTNGMEVFDPGLKLDTRGNTVEEVIEGLEAAMTRAFANVSGSIKALYDLRQTKVADASQAVLRMGRESGLAERTVMALVERVPEVVEDPRNATAFDVVGLVTNAANEPSIRNRLNIRRRLEQAGGSEVADHIARCRTCQAKLN